MVDSRSNIAWYLPKAYAAKLLPIFADIDQWFYKQAQSEAGTDGEQAATRKAPQDGRSAQVRPPQADSSRSDG
jgi:hypothetical protein